MKAYLIIAGVSLAVGLTVGAGVGYDYADTACDAAISDLNAAHSAEKEKALEKSRKWYRDAMAEQQKEMEKLQDEYNQANADKRRLTDSYDGLLKEQRRLFTGLAANNCDPSLVANGAPKACATGVLAELCEVSGKLAGIYAAEATGSRIAGEGCEISYDALDKKK